MAVEADLTITMGSLFDDDEFADLTVCAGDAKFKLHKNILCTASPWFRAACTRGFKESGTALIPLPESALEIKGLLLWLYGLPGRIEDELYKVSFWAEIKLAIRFHMVGDKYACPGLSNHMTQHLMIRLHFSALSDAGEMVDVTVWAYTQNEGRIEVQVLELLAKATAARLHTLFGDDIAWQRLTSCAPYACDVMRYIAASPGFPQLGDTLKKSGRSSAPPPNGRP